MLQSSMVQCLRDQACDMLKREKLKRLPQKKLFSAIRYNQRTFKPYLKRGFVSLCTIHGRIKVTINVSKYFQQYLDWQVKGATLSYGVHIQVAVVPFNGKRDSPKLETSNVLGVDSGIKERGFLRTRW